MKKLFLIGLILFSLSSCKIPPPPTTAPLNPEILRSGGISRFRDEEAGVMCWVLRTGNEGGISCLPLKDTRLGE